MNNKVAILLGSKTDLPLIEPSMQYYEHFGINAEIHVMSAHRNPKDVGKFASEARDNGYTASCDMPEGKSFILYCQ